MALVEPNKKVIEPDHGNNFKPNPTEVVHKIVKCMTSKYDQAWISWKKVPKNVRDMWFREFQKVYQWHPRHSCEIRKHFETRGGKARKTNKCPDWISESVWKQLQYQWKSADFKVRSERAKKNRESDFDGFGSSRHTGGSIPTTEHKRRLETKAGKAVSDVDVFLFTHQRKDKSWIDNRSAHAYEKWSNAWIDMETTQDTSDSGSPSVKLTQDQVWASVNVTKRGTIYGLGAEGGKYKNSIHNYFASSSYLEEKSDKEKKLEEEIEALKKENLEQKEERKQLGEQMRVMIQMLKELKEEKKMEEEKKKKKEKGS